MKRTTLILTALALLFGGVGQGRAGFVTYSIVDYPANQSGYHVDGQITTDGTIGRISDSDIVSWAFTITDSNGNFVGGGSSTLPGAGLDVSADASSSAITFPQNGPYSVVQLYNEGGPDAFQYTADGPLFINNQSSITSYADNTTTGSFLWDNAVPAPNGPFVYADNGTPAVPEPSTLTLLGIGAVSMLVWVWRRRKKACLCLS